MVAEINIQKYSTQPGPENSKPLMSKFSPYQNPNEKSLKTVEPIYRPKSQKKLTFFFGPDEYHHHNHHPIEEEYFSKQNFQRMKAAGFLRTTHNFLKSHHPTLLKFILVFGFPFFILGIVIMFIAALVCIFFIGIYIMVRDLFRQFNGCVAIILLPAAIVVGGIGATLFPYVFKDYIMQIHYEFWFEFAEEYFKELCSVSR